MGLLSQINVTRMTYYACCAVAKFLFTEMVILLDPDFCFGI